ncbi:hypothetical protein DL89DRAFT_271200 [Linderina pennispora]|uniref:Amino acid transporter transmembrane domain-containing protein n=1 Tax=Linderina pennispora TaxID=61395 RepID=A0A1Y1VVC0_9FUNG|nr:uncharacterized protein DL89DRAFT_271200 [Linderina pennispora]ORX65237.1 hypothetical protein DL89DRAFT_271200 [Linderina pennispora]
MQSPSNNPHLQCNANKPATSIPVPTDRRPASISGSLSRATELLLSSSPRSHTTTSPMSRVLRNVADADDSDSSSSTIHRKKLEKAEIARRLKRHLVTRPASSKQRDSVSSNVHAGSIGYTSINDYSGYAGDTNEYYDDDNDDIDDTNREVVDPLTLPSGDITHQIYRWQKQQQQQQSNSEAPLAEDARRDSVSRRRSFSGWDSDSEWNLGYTRDQINVPGGFRRQFMQERAGRQGLAPPGLLTESFIDFIALYGHFAGGYYLSDEDEEYLDSRVVAAAADEGRADERTPLRRTASSLQSSASNKKAFFLLMKAFVGTGVLVLPRAFYNGGLLTSSYAWHCILLLAEVYLKVGGSYSEIGLKLYGRTMQYAVTASIVLAQIGGCCAYTIFVAQNWRNVRHWARNFWVLIQLVVFVPLAMIRQIRYFAPVAMVANILIVSIAQNGSAPIMHYNPVRFPLLVGTAVYSFEGITLVIPILESLKEKKDFSWVLTSAITLCLGLFLCVGSLSYMTFGDRVEAVVLLNLPNESSWTILVQLFYSVAILFSMPLQLFPAVKIVEAMMFERSGRDHASVKWQKNIFRTLTVFCISAFAIFGADELDNVVSLVGSFCLVPLSFIYPSSMHLKSIARTKWERTKDMVLIAVGVVALFYVTYISIITWGTSDPPLDICKSTP